MHSLDPFWHRKYARDDRGRLVRIPAGAADGQVEAGAAEHRHDAAGDDHSGRGHGIHMPSPSYYPALTAVGLPLVGFGAVYGRWLAIVGALFLMAGIFGWGAEPLAE